MEVVVFEPDQEQAQRYLQLLSAQFKTERVGEINRLLLAIKNSRTRLFLINYDILDKNKTNDFELERLIRSSDAYFLLLSRVPPEKQSILSNQPQVLFLPRDIPFDQLLPLLTALTGKIYRQEPSLPLAEDFLIKSPQMKKILAKIEMVKDKDVLVFLTGETGTGKTALARILHEKSNRRKAPFVHLNCAAIPEGLLEAELFGYKKGAFTGAETDRIGKFKAAGSGTIFLDEIGEISPQLQAKLLKVLDEKEYYPVGAPVPEKVQARIIVATNKNLDREVKEKKFREDLYFRINGVELHIPPLRERQEEIEPLFDFFIRQEAKINHQAIPEIAPGVYELLTSYAWPGNVRELQNLTKTLMLINPERIDVDLLPEEFFDTPKAQLVKQNEQILPLRQMKKEYVRYVYRLSGNRKLKTAAMLKVDIKTLRRLLSD